MADLDIDDAASALEDLQIDTPLEEIIEWISGTSPTDHVKALAVAEKLIMPRLMTRLIRLGPQVRIDFDISNHDMYVFDWDIVDAWARGYRLIYDRTISNYPDQQLFLAALRNGMPVTRLYLCPAYKEEHLRLCSGLKILKAKTEKCKLTYCPPSVVEVVLHRTTHVSPGVFDECRDLRILHIKDFAMQKCPESVTDLDVSGICCQMGDAGLEGCRELYRLNVTNNRHITRCPPSVEILFAGGESGMTEIAHCPKLRAIDLTGNTKIRRLPDSVEELNLTRNHTLEQEALESCRRLWKLILTGRFDPIVCPRWITHLEAAGCGITDEGLRECPVLYYLDVTDNTYVRRCPPSVRILIARRSCGIDDAGLRGTHLKELDVSGNPRVSICPPSVEILRAERGCGISDKGLEGCVNLKKLSAGLNPKITRCPEYIEELWVTRSLSSEVVGGIDDAGLENCPRLRKLNVSGNPAITRCPDTVKEIGVTTMSGIKDLRGCRGLRKIYAAGNREVLLPDVDIDRSHSMHF